MMRFRLAVPLLVAVLGAAPAQGLTPRLVKDINPVPTPQDSSPQGYATAGGLAFFAADDGDTGIELWRTDGTAAGTSLVADACPGECSSQPVVIAQAGRSVFFQAFGRGFGPVDLWVTDGSPAGTVRLAGPLLLPDSGRQSLWVPSQGVLYFAADDLLHGNELWRSDGTPAGTFLVKDVRPDREGSAPAGLTALGGRLYFAADDGRAGPSLWTSDGTGEGTRQAFDPLPRSAAHAAPTLLRAVGPSLYFVAPVSPQRSGLWVMTAGAASLLIDFAATAGFPTFLDTAALGGRLLFVAFEPGRGYELWASNGRRGGTVRLTRFPPVLSILPFGNTAGRPLLATALAGRLIFRADDGVHGPELWSTDGTREGTRLIRDVCPGPCPGAGAESLIAGDRLVFSADNGSRGLEPWTTDGTPAGTRLLRDLCRGSCSSAPAAFQAADGALYLLARNAANAVQLWRSDGSAQGTVRLTSFTSSPGDPRGIALGSAFLFSARDDRNGRELWRSDGTLQGTGLLLDINSRDAGGSFPADLQQAGDKAWFFADDGVGGYELWASDGTETGTVLIHELTPGAEPAVSPGLLRAAESGGQTFLLVQQPADNLALWRSAGTPGSTARLTTTEVRAVASEPLLSLHGRVLFVAVDPEHGEELWTSDGTPAGTRPLADLLAGPQGSEPRGLKLFQDRLYFTAGGAAGRELWTSDGTAAGTVLVRDIDPRPGRGADPQLLTEHAGRLYFLATDEENGPELWSSDGTAAGTTLAADLTPGPDGFFMTHIVSTGGRLFFSGGPPDITLHGLYAGDGTAAGTRLVSPRLIQLDPRPVALPAVLGSQIFYATTGDQVLWASDGSEERTAPLLSSDGMELCEPESYQALDGKLHFTTAQEGWLYQSDGTAEGTVKLLELAAPFEDGASFPVVRAGHRLLFRKWDRLTGSELWVLE